MKRTAKNSATLQKSTFEQFFGPMAVRPSLDTLDFWGLRPESTQPRRRKPKGAGRSAPAATSP